MLKLRSVGSVLDTKTRMVYPQYKNGTIDFSNGVLLIDCTDEWWGALNRLDNKNLMDLPIKKHYY